MSDAEHRYRELRDSVERLILTAEREGPRSLEWADTLLEAIVAVEEADVTRRFADPLCDPLSPKSISWAVHLARSSIRRASSRATSAEKLEACADGLRQALEGNRADPPFDDDDGSGNATLQQMIGRVERLLRIAKP